MRLNYAQRLRDALHLESGPASQVAPDCPVIPVATACELVRLWHLGRLAVADGRVVLDYTPGEGERGEER